MLMRICDTLALGCSGWAMMMAMMLGNKMKWAAVAGGARLRLAIDPSFYYFGTASVPVSARVEGQRCGCTAGRVRLAGFQFLPLSLSSRNLDLEEGLGWVSWPRLSFPFLPCLLFRFQGC